MAHEVGVQRQETIKRGCLAARALIESGVTDWSPETITTHLKTNEAKRSAAWFRGFLAYLIVNDIATDEDAHQVLSALNPGHWTSSGVSNAYFEFVQEFSDSLEPVVVHGHEPASHPDIDAFDDDAMPPEQPEPDDDPDRAILASWLDQHFSSLSADRASMLPAFVESLLEPGRRAISGDWPEALLRSSQALTQKGWRVAIADSPTASTSPVEIDRASRSIVLANPSGEAAQALLRTLGRLTLEGGDRHSTQTEALLDLAAELVGCLAGWALRADFVGASLFFARSKLLASDVEPKQLYASCFDATIDGAADLLDLLLIEPAALSS